jgi:hypothetical protein
MAFFSRNRKSPPQVFASEINQPARMRIWQTYVQMINNPNYELGVDLYMAFNEIWEIVLREFPGQISQNLVSQHFTRRQDIVCYHFGTCSSEHALDVIQMMLSVQHHVLYHTIGPRLVEEFNRIFREEGIGYELTPLKVEMIAHTGPRPGFGPDTTEYQTAEYTEPAIIPIANDLTRTEIMEPTLALLSDKGLATANDEMMDAYRHFRKGEYDDAIVACQRSFETFFKTICKTKGWTYKENEATLSALVEVCRAKGLFYPFYVAHFTSVGTIGNKLGRHGAEPKPEYTPGKEHVQHLLNVTSSCMLLLAKLL